MELNTSESSDGVPVRYEVINVGIPHLQSDQIYSLFMGEAVPLDPDIVTYYQGYTNVTGGGRGGAVSQSAKRVPLVGPIFRELRRRVLTSASVADQVFGRSYAPHDATVSGFQGESHAKQRQFVANLDAIHQECEKWNIQFVVAGQQARSMNVDREENQGVSYAAEMSLVRSKLESEGAILDLEREVLSHPQRFNGSSARVGSYKWNYLYRRNWCHGSESGECLIDWMHLNADRNRVVASALPNKISELFKEKD